MDMERIVELVAIFLMIVIVFYMQFKIYKINRQYAKRNAEIAERDKVAERALEELGKKP